MGISIKDKFRMVNGYDHEHKCGDCVFLARYAGTKRSFFKCEKMGYTSSVATDIRLKDTACNLFKEEV